MPLSRDDLQLDYKKRVNSVFMFIDENLDTDLSLKTVSEIAFFSPFHFHRLFKAITKETVNEYITRQRIEKSASDLLHKTESISEISYKYGFTDNASFTRTFKKFYGVSPSEFKKQNPNKFSKIRALKSKIGQTYPNYEKYICIIDTIKKWTKMNAKIEIVETKQLIAAGLTHIGTNGVENAFEKVISWAISKDLFKNSEAKMGRIYYDSFKVTAVDKVRMNVFLLTNEAFKPEGEINKLSIEAGKYLVGNFEILPTEFEKSWTGLFIWMNENGYKKRKENPFEIYHNDFREHPENKFIVDLYIPIE